MTYLHQMQVGHLSKVYGCVNSQTHTHTLSVAALNPPSAQPNFNFSKSDGAGPATSKGIILLPIYKSSDIIVEYRILIFCDSA